MEGFRRLLLVGAVLLATALSAQAAIPDCPAEQPYGECAAGNPCAASPCGAGFWCQLGCGCAYKCLGNNIVTIAAADPAAANPAAGAVAGGASPRLLLPSPAPAPQPGPAAPAEPRAAPLAGPAPWLQWPKAPCQDNEAVNVTATLRALPSLLLGGQQPAVVCKACPDGTVSKQPALACTLCLPGTFADRQLSACRKCAKGYYAPAPGARFCSPCPRDTVARLAGSPLCAPCPKGSSTGGKKAQAACAFGASPAKL